MRKFLSSIAKSRTLLPWIGTRKGMMSRKVTTVRIQEVKRAYRPRTERVEYFKRGRRLTQEIRCCLSPSGERPTGASKSRRPELQRPKRLRRRNERSCKLNSIYNNHMCLELLKSMFSKKTVVKFQVETCYMRKLRSSFGRRRKAYHGARLGNTNTRTACSYTQ